jgi:hypothetical protein
MPVASFRRAQIFDTEKGAQTALGIYAAHRRPGWMQRAWPAARVIRAE